MNKNLNTVIISCFSALIMVVTNPKKEDYISEINSKIQEVAIFNNEAAGSFFWKSVGASLSENVIGSFIRTDSFLFFSASKAKIDGKYQYVSVGFLGNVFLFFNEEDVKNLISQLEENSEN